MEIFIISILLVISAFLVLGTDIYFLILLFLHRKEFSHENKRSFILVIIVVYFFWLCFYAFYFGLPNFINTFMRYPILFMWIFMSFIFFILKKGFLKNGKFD
jgi:preprotein translocase subunit SecE